MNAAGLSTTLQRHVTNVTSPAPPTHSPVTSRAPAHTSSRADYVVEKLGHQKVPLYDGDINIPSDSYFTGDEEIPVWNAPDHVPLMDAAASVAAAEDDDDKLLALGHLLAQLSSYIEANGSDINRVGSDKSRDVVSVHKLVTSSVSDVESASAGYRDEADEASSRQTSYSSTTTVQLQAQVPRTTTLSPRSQIISRLLANRTNSTSSRDRSHDQRDAATMTSNAVQDVGSDTSRSVAAVSSHSYVEKAAAAVATKAVTQLQQRQQQQQQAAGGSGGGGGGGVLTNPGRPAARQLGGFGNWGGPRATLDYFDFFDYIVDYQTHRPPTLRRLRTNTRRRQRNRVKPKRVNRGRFADRTYTEQRRDIEDQLDVVGQSYGIETTDTRPLGRRPGSHKRLPKSVSDWIVGGQPQNPRPSVKNRGRSALYLATRANRKLQGPIIMSRKLLKEGKDMNTHVEPLQRPVSIVHGYDLLHRVIYSPQEQT